MVRRKSLFTMKKRTSPKVLTMKKTSMRTTKTPPASESSPKIARDREAKRTRKAQEVKKSASTGKSSAKGDGAGRARRASEKAASSTSVQGRSNKKVKGKNSNGSAVFPVEAIRGIQMGSGDTFQFFVKWEGYDEAQNNWEPEKNVRLCKPIILKFLEGISKHLSTFPE